jgi:hypothetical protein
MHALTPPPGDPYEIVCHGCKHPAPPNYGGDNCPRCNYFLVTRRDLQVWARLRPICVVSLVVFLAFCWFTGVKWSQGLFVITMVMFAVPSLIAEGIVRMQRPDWMHNQTVTEISVAAGAGIGLPAMMVYLCLIGGIGGRGGVPDAPTGPAVAVAAAPSPRPAIEIVPNDDRDSEVPDVGSGVAVAKYDGGEAVISPADFAALRQQRELAVELLASLPKETKTLRAEFEDRAGLLRMMMPSALADAKQVSASRSRARRLVGRLDGVETARRNALSALPGLIEASSASPAAKRAFFARTRRAAAPAVAEWNAFIATERQILQESDALLALLERLAGRYTVANNQFRFARAEDAAAVQRHRKKLAVLWTQLNATTTRLHERCDQGVIAVKR